MLHKVPATAENIPRVKLLLFNGTIKACMSQVPILMLSSFEVDVFNGL